MHTHTLVHIHTHTVDQLTDYFRRDVATSVVTVLCTNSSVSLRVIFSYLPLISGSQSELDISRFILKNSKNPIIKHISQGN